MKMFVIFLLWMTMLSAKANADIAADTTIHIKVDTDAKYPGGIPALSNFIAQHVELPGDGSANIKGNLKYAFVIEKDGSISDCKVLDGFTPAVNAAFIKALKQTLKWTPGKLRGNSVRQQYFVSMTFESSQKETELKDTELSAAYPGGADKFYNYLSDNLKYPAKTRADKLEGKVKVSFVIDTDGSLTDIKIEQSLSAETDEEVLRLIKASQKWKPAQRNGKPVRQKFTISIPFKL